MSSFVLLRFAVYVDGTMATFFWPCSSRLPAGRGHTERSVFDFLGENFVVFANFRGIAALLGGWAMSFWLEDDS